MERTISTGKYIVSHRRSIVTFFVVCAFTGLFSLLGRGARLQQSTYNVTGKVVGGPPVLQSRPGGDLYLSLEAARHQDRPLAAALSTRKAKG